MAEDADTAHIEKYQKAIGKAASSGPLAFQQWFCKSESLRETKIRGCWDFAVHILTPKVIAEISNPEDRTVLEIGYGGGRILNAASSFFGYAIGVDIHKEPIEHGDNVSLLVGDGKTIPVTDATVDLVYSFIVLLHLQSYEAFVSYLRESYRVLKKGGIAQLYFGLQSEDGSKHRDAPANHASLLVSSDTAQEEAKRIGFEVIDTGKSYKQVPNGYPNAIGQQGYITLKR